MSEILSEASSESLSSRYDPKEVEQPLYQMWESAGYFKSQDTSTKPPYAIILPPPNVTGSLHLGHALDHTIQDVLIRWKRMSGFNALWLPGTDHAGIATQMVVEKTLVKEGVKRKDLGRDGFLEKVWQWKHQYGNRIVEQMKRLGDSCDWDRLRFTLDEGVSKAVRKVFVDMYKQNLIYKGTRLVNWDTHLESAVSDLEVDHQTRKGSLWHIQYFLEGSTTEFVTVATTRPETLLGDVAVAVHPNDDRYENFVGKNVVLPLLGRKIPVIADDAVTKDFGSGVVKITPAHDFNDYEMGSRHKLKAINILNLDGTLNDNAGPYKGLTVLKAREKVLVDLKEKGLLVKEEPHTLTVPISERTGAVIEPMLSAQWFMAMKKMAEPAKRAVETSTTSFEPELWTKTYLHWMNTIEDWCVSRQLWWGHRIPAWHCKSCQHFTVSETDPTQCEKCKSVEIRQDEDVLDTWFSSALWPFSTLGWPENTEALKTFYPTDVLVTGHDIIFFWVARMMMQGVHFMKDVPFRTVYIHGLIRDSEGKKMSKSVGNALDPLELIDKYGADALRFTLLAQLAAGRDLKFSEQRLEGYRNFMNKIWNATRFALSTLEDFDTKNLTLKTLPQEKDLSFYDKWIIHRLKKIEEEVEEAFEGFRFSDATQSLYGFVWNDFCDWYLELIKPTMYGEASDQKRATQLVLCHVLNRIVRLLHPLTPFISEAIYQKLPMRNEAAIVDEYPTVRNDKAFLSLGSEVVAKEVDLLREVITAVRNIRGENRIKPGTKIPLKIVSEVAGTQEILKRNEVILQKLTSAEPLEICAKTSLAKCAVAPISNGTEKILAVVPLEGLVDFQEEITRLEKTIEKTQKEAGGIEGRLRNENFVKNAPPDVVVQDRQRVQQLIEQIGSLRESLERLKG